MRARLTLLLLGCIGGAASVVELTIAASAEEPRRVIDMGRAFDAGSPRTPPKVEDIPITSTPADPPPMVERLQWVFDLRWDRGDVWLLGTRPLDLGQPRATPRVMGRFALELFEGAALVERVRFDFPLLGPPEADGGISLWTKLRTRIGVIFPMTNHGNRLELVDRATGRRWAMPWPPARPTTSPDAGAGPSATTSQAEAPMRWRGAFVGDAGRGPIGPP
jgi:hypothetical protein